MCVISVGTRFCLFLTLKHYLIFFWIILSFGLFIMFPNFNSGLDTFISILYILKNPSWECPFCKLLFSVVVWVCASLLILILKLFSLACRHIFQFRLFCSVLLISHINTAKRMLAIGLYLSWVMVWLSIQISFCELVSCIQWGEGWRISLCLLNITSRNGKQFFVPFPTWNVYYDVSRLKILGNSKIPYGQNMKISST